MTAKHKGVLYLHRNGCEIAIHNSKQIFTVPIPSDIMVDLEIINEDKLISLIAEFCSKNHIENTQFLIVVGSSCLFTAVSDQQNPDEGAKQKSAFLHSVPFQNTATVTQTVKTKHTYIAANEDVLNAFKSALEQAKSTAMEATHQLLFPRELPSESTLTQQAAQALLGYVGTIKPTDNFFAAEHPTTPHATTLAPTIIQPEEKKSTLPYLIPVFVLLLGILGFVFYTQRNTTENQVPNSQIVSPTQPIQPTSTPTSAPQKSEDELIKEFGNISIQILNGSGVGGQANVTRSAFEQLGFTNIAVGNAESAQQNATVVVFTEGVPLGVQTVILNMLKEVYAEVRAQQTRDAASQVIITIGTGLISSN